MSSETETGAGQALAAAALPVLRAFTAMAEASLAEVAPAMTLQQFRALTVLHERGPQRAASLAAALDIAPSTLTRLVDRLVRVGLVERSPDTADRRAVVLSITRRGAGIADRVKTWRLRELARCLSEIDPADHAVVADALRRVGDVVDGARAT